MNRVFSLIMLLSGIVLIGCANNAGEGTPAAELPPTATITVPVLSLSDESDVNEVDEVLLARGIEVYRAQYCGSCHALDAANTRGIFGPPHNAVALDAEERINAENYVGDAQTAEAYLRESILEPKAYFTPGYAASNHQMPAYGHLPEEDIDAMVYMLLQQRNLEEPTEQ